MGITTRLAERRAERQAFPRRSSDEEMCPLGANREIDLTRTEKPRRFGSGSAPDAIGSAQPDVWKGVADFRSRHSREGEGGSGTPGGWASVWKGTSEIGNGHPSVWRGTSKIGSGLLKPWRAAAEIGGGHPTRGTGIARIESGVVRLW